MQTVVLSNEDMIYKEIRNRPYEALGHYFKQKTINIENTLSNQSKSLQELTENVAKIKNLDIPKLKPLIDRHNLLCYTMKQTNKDQTIKSCFMLEQNIIHSEEPKEIMKKLETKIAR